MFCSKCGNEILAGDKFCSGCGAAAIEGGDIQETPNKNSVRVGFSSKINDPSLQNAMKSNAKGTIIFAIILALLPIIVTFFIGVSNDDFEAMPIGLAISAVIIVFNLVSIAKKKSEKQWDGVVLDKKNQKVHERSTDGEYHDYTKYTIVFKDDNGKKRKLEEGNPGNSAHPYYDYLNIGDRVRYYPQFNCFYEKYDKTHDTYLYCPICGSKNDIAKDNCDNCGVILLK